MATTDERPHRRENEHVFRKIILVIATLALIAVAFAIYAWREEATLPMAGPLPVPAPIEPTTTQPGSATQPADDEAALAFKDVKILPGPKPRARIYDPKTGEAKIIFQADEWKPISDTEFDLTHPSARILLPGGQLAYIKAIHGQIKMQADDDDNLNPKSGRFQEEVEILLDLTEPEWRREHPELTAPETHPEAIVRIWMDNAEFDLDLARLSSTGNIRVQSSRGSIEGRGLELVWSETDRRVKMLRIVEGKRATIAAPGLERMATLPGSGEVTPAGQGSAAPWILSPDQPSATAPAEPAGANATAPEPPTAEPSSVPDAPPTKVPSVALADPHADAPTTSAAPTGSSAAPIGETAFPEGAMSPNRQARLAFIDEGNEPKPRKDRVDTYKVVFDGNVTARQMVGDEEAGHLTADVLTLLADFGEQERAAVEHIPATQAADGTTQPATAPATRPATPEESNSRIVLTWSGELLLEPAPSPATQPEAETQPADEPVFHKRLHITAEGQPVQLRDRKQGSAVCTKLEYHLETNRVWLTGGEGQPVFLRTGEDRELRIERSLFFDYQQGIATIDGPGRMSRRSPDEQPVTATRPAVTEPAIAAPDRPGGDESLGALAQAGDVELRWSKRGEIRFGEVRFDAPVDDTASAPVDSDEAQSAGRRVTYLERAIFEGDVHTTLRDEAIRADRVDVAFFAPEPAPKGASEAEGDQPTGQRAGMIDTLQAERIVAEGNVRMRQEKSRRLGRRREQRVDTVECERLVVDMTVTDTGQNLPRTGHAFGEVVARQSVQSYLGPMPLGPPAIRDIRAAEEMEIELAAIPIPVTDLERQAMERQARSMGLTPDSPAWQTYEQKLRDRREITIRSLTARGDVAARDEKRALRDLTADFLQCRLDEHGQLERAFLRGWDDRPAHVDHGQFYIRGYQVSLDLASQSIEVPGEGLLRFATDQDLDGRPLNDTVPIIITWGERMWMRGEENVGTFSGDVRAISNNNVLETRELRLRFAPPSEPDAETALAATQPADNVQTPGMLGTLVEAARGPADSPENTTATRGPLNRELTRVDAFGDAVFVSSSYAAGGPANPGLVTEVLADLIPESLRPPTTQPAVEDPRPLISRIRLAGPQIRVDLMENHLLVEGRGTLLVEDYRLPKPASGGSDRGQGSTFLVGSSVPGLGVTGPSQTLFTWENSMTFLSKRNMAVFDRDVVMRHRAGREVALAGPLREAIQLNPSIRRRLQSRSAGLTCSHLIAQFLTEGPTDNAGSGSPLARATGLESFRATGRVMFVDRDGNVKRTASGSAVTFNQTSGVAEIAGSARQPAILEEVDSRTGRLTAQRRGGTIRWNLKTRKITAERSTILAPR